MKKSYFLCLFNINQGETKAIAVDVVLGGQDKVPVIYGADADFLLDDFILQTIDHHNKNPQNTKIIQLNFYSLLAAQKSIGIVVGKHKQVY